MFGVMNERSRWIAYCKTLSAATLANTPLFPYLDKALDSGRGRLELFGNLLYNVITATLVLANR